MKRDQGLHELLVRIKHPMTTVTVSIPRGDCSHLGIFLCKRHVPGVTADTQSAAALDKDLYTLLVQ
jgi:hypothetical protein